MTSFMFRMGSSALFSLSRASCIQYRAFPYRVTIKTSTRRQRRASRCVEEPAANSATQSFDCDVVSPVFYRLAPVVGIGPMAAGGTCPAGWRRLVSQRHPPLAELRSILSQQMREVGPMRFMADSAGPPFPHLGHMEEMEI